MRVWDTANTARSIESSIDSIASLVDKRCDEIMAGVEGGQKGVRALDTLTDEAVGLVNQLAVYEKTLGQGLDALREKIVAVQTATVQATLFAQAQKEEKMRNRRMAALADLAEEAVA